jgi:hypothetical protein
MNEQFPPPTNQRNPQQPDTLSGQQLQALAKQHADAIAAIKRDIELRKWAVDQACGLVGAMVESEESSTITNPVVLAREIHAFLVEAAVDKTN